MFLFVKEYPAAVDTLRQEDECTTSLFVGREVFHPPMTFCRRLEGQPRFRSDVELIPNSHGSYSSTPATIHLHGTTDIMCKNRKPHLKSSELRNSPNDYVSVSKLCQETKGIYCGILSDYARESGDYHRPLEQRGSEYRLMHKHDRLPNHITSTTINPENGWRFYQKGL